MRGEDWHYIMSASNIGIFQPDDSDGDDPGHDLSRGWPRRA